MKTQYDSIEGLEKDLADSFESWLRQDGGFVSTAAPKLAAQHFILRIQALIQSYCDERARGVLEPKLTSHDWNWLVFGGDVVVLDPDGWDRKNYKYSWYEERITIKEFRGRVMLSTVQMKLDDTRLDDMVKKYAFKSTNRSGEDGV